MEFSVLMSVYAGDRPEWLDEALRSILIDQEVKPSEVVFIVDGPVSEDLMNVINKYESFLSVYKLEKNSGLTKALDFGIKKCSYEWVARMDSDDLSHPERFKKQLNYLKKHQELEVLGTCLGKFEENKDEIYSTICRKDPYKLVKFRTPLSHATVFYKKSVVLSVGGYSGAPNKMEDYWLWIKMINKKVKMDTLQEVLYLMRSDVNVDIRRGGVDFFLNEIALQKEMKRLGIINNYEFIRNVIVKGGFRLVPAFIRGFLYQRIIGRNGKKIK